MSSCFICGSIEEKVEQFISTIEFDDIIYNFLKSNGISEVYTCNRNMFDDMCEDAVNIFKSGLGIKLYKIVGNTVNDIWYMLGTDTANSYYDDIIYPFNHHIDELERYLTLYKWLINKCDFMLTFIVDDSDISISVKSNAESNNVKIINIANMFSYRRIDF